MVFACEYGRLQKRSWQPLHGFSLRPLRSAQPHPSKCWAIAAKAPFQPSPSRPFHRWRAPPRRGSVRTPRMKVPGAAWRGATSSRLTSAFCRTALSAERRGVGVGQQRAVRPRGHLSIGRSWLTLGRVLAIPRPSMDHRSMPDSNPSRTNANIPKSLPSASSQR